IGLFAEHTKTVSKKHPDIKQPTNFNGERFSHPSAISGGSTAGIHPDIENFPPPNKPPFCLNLRMFLIMQASENSPKRMRIIILDKGIIDAICREDRPLVSLHK